MIKLNLQLKILIEDKNNLIILEIMKSTKNHNSIMESKNRKSLINFLRKMRKIFIFTQFFPFLTSLYAQQNPSITIVNNTGYPITHVSVIPFAASENWEAKRLAIPNGQSVLWKLEHELNVVRRYNMRLTDSDGKTYKKMEVTVADNSRIEFTSNDLEKNTPDPPPTTNAIDLLKQAVKTNPALSYQGVSYKGEMLNGGLNGMGILLSENEGRIYFGSYKKGKKDGYGVLMMEESDLGKYVVGNFSKDKLNGAVACYDASGKLLTLEEYKNNRLKRSYSTTDITVRTNKFEFIDYDNGAYIGETTDGARDGYGIYVWTNGDLWFGWWKAGKREGRGILIQRDGKMTTGSW